MKWKIATLCLALMVILGGAARSFAQEDDLPATVEALQTQVADLEATNEALQHRLDEQDPTATAMTELTADPDDPDPIQITPELQVAYYRFFVSDMDLKVRGEIVNVTDEPVEAPNVLFQFLDENGELLGEDEAQPMSYWIGPKQRMPFSEFGSLLGGALLPGDWSSVNVTAGSRNTFASGTYSLDLQLLDTEGFGKAGEDAVGRLQNNGDEPVGPISIDPAYFDEEGLFVGSCFGDYLDLKVRPGRTARFSVATTAGCANVSQALDALEAGRVESYRLIVSVAPS